MERADVVIVGGGVMGTAAARALASRGRDVILLERRTIGHAQGSSGGPTRNFRLTYHDPVYVRMARRALEEWRRLESDAGMELLRVVGGLDLGAATDGSVAALEAAGESFERPTATEIAERWPALRVEGQSRFLYQPEGAILRADATIAAQARSARADGAELREDTGTERVRPDVAGVEIVTSGGDVLRAPTAIVAAGAWAASLLGDVGIDLPLRPTLEQSTYLTTEDAVGAIPTVIDWDAAPDQPPYIVPNAFVPGEIKAGAHLSGPPVDPDTPPGPDAEREALVVDWVGRRIHPAPTPTRTETCLYTVAPDEDFVIDRAGPVVVASPCSGHGFKFAPLIGEVLADLATGETPSIPLERFRVDRPVLRR
ncbi:MAG TPA: FAD-dependent oxidoreductase [Actinomycetota bacterium]|nr:FAD-dependent oxidoreductase [Actinomycetota bacterium]